MIAGQDASWLWAAGLIGTTFGIVIGIGIAMLFERKRGRVGKLQQEVEQLQAELEDYRARVTGHFRKTASLVNKMTDTYRDVYEHLAASSQSLCETPFESPRLEVGDSPELNAAIPETAPADRKEEHDSDRYGFRAGSTNEALLRGAPWQPDDPKSRDAAATRTDA